MLSTACHWCCYRGCGTYVLASGTICKHYCLSLLTSAALACVITSRIRTCLFAVQQRVTDEEVVHVLQMRSRIAQLTQSQRARMSEWLTKGLIGDIELLRFLRFNHGHLDAAWQQLTKTAKW